MNQQFGQPPQGPWGQPPMQQGYQPQQPMQQGYQQGYQPQQPMQQGYQPQQPMQQGYQPQQPMQQGYRQGYQPQQPMQQGGFMQSYFSGIEQAQPGFGSSYLHPGHNYVLLVAGNKAGPSQKKRGVINFVGEFRVLESTDQARPAGSQASYVCPSDKASTLGNWKAYMAAVCGLNPSNTEQVNQQITTQLCEFAVSAEQPLAGKLKDGRYVILRCTTEQVPTKQVGGVYTKHSFLPILPGTEEYNRYAPMAERMLAGGGPSPAPAQQAPTMQQAPSMQQYAAPQGHAAPTAPAPYGAPQGVPTGGGQPSPYGQPPVAQATPQAQWVTHPHDPNWEWIPGTQNIRMKGSQG